jgi:hypothetical protein
MAGALASWNDDAAKSAIVDFVARVTQLFFLIDRVKQLAAKDPVTFKEFPPRQKAATFTIDQAMEKMEAAISGAGH